MTQQDTSPSVLTGFLIHYSGLSLCSNFELQRVFLSSDIISKGRYIY